jgi:hypothetical protein
LLLKFSLFFFLLFAHIEFFQIFSFPEFFRTETIDNDPIDPFLNINYDDYDIIDMSGATYSSDGNNLNVTLWLNNPDNTDLTTDKKIIAISYSMLIDSDNNLYTGNVGIEYVMQYQFLAPLEGVKRITYSIYELPIGFGTTTSYIDNYEILIYNKSKIEINNVMTNSSYYTSYYGLQNTIFKEIIKPAFYQAEGSTINYNLPLDKISKSQEMRLYFKNMITYNSFDKVIDSFGPIYIPPAEYYIKIDPNSIELRPNSKELVNIFISNISSSYISYVNLSAFNVPDNIKIKSTKANASVPLVGTNDVLLNSIIIESLDTSNSSNVVYLPIKVNIKFPNPKIEADPFSNVRIDRYPGELKDYTTKTLIHNYPIRLLPPQTIYEIVSEKLYLLTYEIEKFWDKTGEFLNFIYIPFAAIMTWFIKKTLDKRKKRTSYNKAK